MFSFMAKIQWIWIAWITDTQWVGEYDLSDLRIIPATVYSLWCTANALHQEQT